MRVAAIQMAHGDSLADNLETAARMIDDARRGGARVALLPEYFFVHEGIDMPLAARGVRDLLSKESGPGFAVAANCIEATSGNTHNLGLVYDDGKEILSQPKAQPMPRELAEGVAGGNKFAVADVDGVSVGQLVCADILFPEASQVLAKLGAQLVLNPVLSSYYEDDPSKEAREWMYATRAYDSGAFFLKAGGFRRGGAHQIVGRSLIAAPWGVLARYKDQWSAEIVTADLDLEKLGAFRKSRERFPARRPDAYRQLDD